MDNRIHDRDNRLRESKFGGGRRLGAGHGKEEIAGSTADRPIAVYYAQFSRDRPIGGELFDLLDKMLNALRHIARENNLYDINPEVAHARKFTVVSSYFIGQDDFEPIESRLRSANPVSFKISFEVGVLSQD